MEVDRSGRLILRLYTEKNNPHGRLLSIFRWSADTGKAEHTFGRRSIAGGSGECGLELERDGDLLVAGGADAIRMASGRGRFGQMGQDLQHLLHSRHVRLPAADGHQPGLPRADLGLRHVEEPDHVPGRRGQLAGLLWRCGTIDDRNGIDLCCPAGLKVMKDGEGNEWLYVADVGNQRIVRFMVK